MDFFESQDKARKATTKLVLIYAFFVVALMATIHLIVTAIATIIVLSDDSGSTDIPEVAFKQLILNPILLIASLGGVALVIGIGSLIKTAQLSQGGSKVALSLGGREILPDTSEYKERRLLNIVEEMALASGVPMPRVFVLDKEPGINAFAAGFSTNDAAVAVTRGSLDLFNREELQAVIGHEFSHILNGDMRLNIRMISVLFGILCIALLGQIVIRLGRVFLMTHRPRRSSKDKDNTAAIGIGLVVGGALLWLIGSVGVLCARIMQAMISRQREHLADASSVQFTRNPAAMANALKMIGANATGSTLTSVHASEVSHMLFASGLKMNLFATHPKLEDRIRNIEPSFDGNYQDAYRIIERRQAAQISHVEENDEEALHESLIAGAAILRRGLREMATENADTVQPDFPMTGMPPAEKPDHDPSPSENVTNALPADAREAIRTPLGAQACICAAVLSTDPAILERQFAITTQSASSAFTKHVTDWQRVLAPLSMASRRITCERAVNTLRVLPRPELEKTLTVLDQLVAADGQIDAFEFALTRMYRSRLLPDVSNSRRGTVDAAERAEQAAYVLNVLARFGTPDRAAACKAWHAGAAKLPSFGTLPKTVCDADIDLPRFEKALHALVQLTPIAKRELIESCEAVAEHDGEITDIEDNFLFAISDLIEAPPATDDR